MSSEGTKASIADSKTIVAAEEAPARETPVRLDEGLGVFRALLLTALFYAAFGILIWFAWHAFRHWHGH